MECVITSKKIDKEQWIYQVYKVEDMQNRTMIKWDCLKEAEFNLIVVIRKTTLGSLDLKKLHDTLDMASVGGEVFVYSRRESEAHIEYNRSTMKSDYYVYPAKLIDDNKIEIFEQTNGKNMITSKTKAISIDVYLKPKCILHYEWSFPFFFGGWNKKGYLYVIGKSRYADKDIVHYKVSGNSELYSLRLTDASNEIIIPLRFGETVSFMPQELELEKKTFFQWFYWKYFKHGKEVV